MSSRCNWFSSPHFPHCFLLSLLTYHKWLAIPRALLYYPGSVIYLIYHSGWMMLLSSPESISPCLRASCSSCRVGCLFPVPHRCTRHA
ncbi:hypothetical protein A0H81_10483 [Grifola frondosa]|uniref:Uncharacterized protein n=1 Tax=Grifola frondosa TaxID=5627 RepID=A0A1C7LZY9_GRIFR|nr:hypothetical protein A0H81_10483 [Grifola frondosa]